MKGLIAVIAFSLMFGPAFAQTTGAPAAAQNDMNKPGMNNPDKGSMNQGTTGTQYYVVPRGDASTSGAGPAAGPHNTGSAKEPGAVQKGVLRADRKKHGIKAIVTIRSPFQVEWRIMGIENEVAETPREPVTRDTDDKLPKFKERTLQRSNFDRQSRELPEPRTKLLEPAEIWRDLTQRR